MARYISTIAEEIVEDMKKLKARPAYTYGAAWPYLDAMRMLSELDDWHGLDKARSIVRYFLANAGTWRGEPARRIKK